MKERRFREPLLDKLDRKFGRYALRNLMLIIIIGTAVVFGLEYIVTMRAGQSIIQWLYFDKRAILNGEVWRVVTFLFVPDTFQILYLALGLYIDWLIGSTLENEWGALRFDLFYLCGVLGAIVAGFIGGYVSNAYLNSSLFFAFAILNPDFKLLLFFFIPIKVKYIAIFEAVSYVLLFIVVGWVERLALVMSLVNILIFFGATLIRRLKAYIRRKKFQREARRPNDNDYPFDL